MVRASESFDFEGRSLPFLEGDTVASALYRAGVRTFTRSFKYHRRRGLYCLTGDCPNCLVRVDGEPCVAACRVSAEPGRRVERESGWPSAEHDLIAVNDRLRLLLPVGFYYKTIIRPRWLWPLAEPVIRRVAGLGSIDLAGQLDNREQMNHHPDVLVVGGGVAGLAAALAAAERGERVILCEESKIGERVSSPAVRERIEQLRRELNALENVLLLEQAPAVGIYEGPLVPIDGEDFLH